MNTTTPSIRLRGLVATAIFSTLASSFAAVCAAADESSTVSEIVKYGDLDVSKPQGAATLYRRIVLAAKDVCGQRDAASFDLTFRARLEACVHKATADAVTKVGQPELFAIYNSKNREPLPVILAATESH